jgi:hypothetical protein
VTLGAQDLPRTDLDVIAGTVTVRQAQVELDTGELVTGPPKSRAGPRTVTLPQAIIPDLRWHPGNLTGPDPEALIFTGKPAASRGRRTSGGPER